MKQQLCSIERDPDKVHVVFLWIIQRCFFFLFFFSKQKRVVTPYSTCLNEMVLVYYYDGSNEGHSICFVVKYEKLSLSYQCYPILFGAQYS